MRPVPCATHPPQLKNLYGKDKPNPYHLGLARNCLYAFCPPHAPAPVDFEQWLHPDTARELSAEAAAALQLSASANSVAAGAPAQPQR